MQMADDSGREITVERNGLGWVVRVAGERRPICSCTSKPWADIIAAALAAYGNAENPVNVVGVHGVQVSEPGKGEGAG